MLTWKCQHMSTFLINLEQSFIIASDKPFLVPHEQTSAFWFLSDAYANMQQQQQPEYTHKHENTHAHTQQYTWLALSPAFLSVSALISWPHSEPRANEQRISSRTQYWGEITLLFTMDRYSGSFSVLTLVLQTCLLLNPPSPRVDHPVQSQQRDASTAPPLHLDQHDV